MTPNFTLSLSFEGIRLLHRVTEGWHVVDEVALDVEDLSAALAELRDKALALDPDGLRTKILLPNDQIKYTSIDTTRTEIEDIHAALDGATPYAISDLAIDFDRTGGRTHIAAVALETLAEAEAFAVEHKFAPMCFAAVSEPFTFRSEVFFGMTEFAKATLAPGEDVARDDKPVEVTGNVAELEPEPIEIDAEKEGLPAEAEVSDTPEAAPAEPTEEDSGEEIVFASRARGPNAVVTPIDPPEIEPLFTRRKEPLVIDPATDAAPVADIVPPIVAPSRATEATTPENDMTVFGARKTAQVGGKPRFLGLILLLLLLVFMAAVAMWANTLGPSGIAGWFGGGQDEVADPVEVAVAPAPIIETPIEEVATVTAPVEEVAAPIPAPTSPAGTLPIVREPTGRVLSPSEADRTYAATGVYQRAPRMPLVPRTTTLDGLQMAVAIPSVDVLDGLSLPDMALMFPDQPLGAQLNPPPPGQTFPRDVRGFILATPEGTVTPDGVIVVAGAPDKEPPLRPGTEVPEIVETTPSVLPGDEGLRLVAGRPPLVPPLRPEVLAPEVEEVIEPEAIDPDAPIIEGLNVVAGRPPRTPPLRPEAFAAFAVPEEISAPSAEEPAVEIAAVVINPTDAFANDGSSLRTQKPTVEEAPEEADVTSLIAGIAAAAPDNPIVTPTRRAIVASPRPDTRPRNIATLVANAVARQPAATAATTEVSSAPARATGPIPGSVAQAATIDNAIRLRDLNLIGVYGRSNDRRALVRLSNGRYVKVEVGSALDGGQVTAIGDSALNYVKRGRTYALELPSG